MGAEVYHALRGLLKKQGLSTGVGDEGGFAPNLKSHEQGLDLLVEAIGHAGFRPGEDVWLALDCAASELWNDGQYVFRKSGAQTKSTDDLIRLYAGWLDKYPIYSIEDPLTEQDWDGWKAITSELGNRRSWSATMSSSRIRPSSAGPSSTVWGMPRSSS